MERGWFTVWFTRAPKRELYDITMYGRKSLRQIHTRLWAKRIEFRSGLKHYKTVKNGLLEIRMRFNIHKMSQ